MSSSTSKLLHLAAALSLCACGERGMHAGDEVMTVEQALSVCAGPQTLAGIDVSSYQGNINWSQVAGSGIKFAYTKATESLSYHDAYFSANWSGMKANGIARGAYHFFHPNISGKQQADYYLAYVGQLGQPGDLPPMLDWEVSSGASASTAAANAQEFIDEVRAKTGLTTVIYTSPGIWSGFGISQSFSAEPLWVAHYLFCTGAGCCPTLPSGWNSWVAWQWSDKGSVPGISGNVDLDLFNGDLSALQNFGGGPVCTGPIGHGVGTGGKVSGACSGATPATSLPGGCGAIGSGLGLQKGQSVTSCDGRFTFVLQTDGNLVEYANGVAMWNAGTQPDGAAAVMQGDGNLVVYSSAGCPLWASNTAGHNGARLAVQDDGNLVVYDGTTALWSSGSGPLGAKPSACGTVKAGEALAPGAAVSACGGCFDLVMQSDGNLVVYKKGGTALWNSHTAGTDGFTTSMQADGNVVLYSRQGCALWSSNSGGHSGARLVMQDDGNLVVYDSANNPLWNAGSVSCAGGCTCNPPPPPPDAGTPPPPDAGTPPELDAGAPPEPDAGRPPEPGGGDAGNGPGGPGVGTPSGPGPGDVLTPAPHGAEPMGPVQGGCSAAGGTTSLLAFGFAAWVLLKRRGG